MVMIKVEDTTLKKGGVRRGGESIPLNLKPIKKGMDGFNTNNYNDTTLDTREGTRGSESIPL